jgi:hypothetical protein
VHDLLRATRPGQRVILRLDSESAWEILAADALELRDHGREVSIISSPVTRLLFDGTMLVSRPGTAAMLTFSERAPRIPTRSEAGGRLVARQGRWKIVEVEPG